jgi:SAM-dependent methyltransferase
MSASHAAAVEALEGGRIEEGCALLADLVRGELDLDHLNDLAVAAHLDGRHEDSEALLRAALVLDASHADARANLELVRGHAAAWREQTGVGGSDPKMWERAFPGMPNHGTMGEHAVRYAFAMSRVGGRDVLDLGCGTGYGAEMLTWSAARVRGFDLWRPTEAQRPVWTGGAELHYAHDLCRDPLPMAEAATMFEVIEHLPDAPAALALAWDAVDTIIASFPNPVHHGSHMNQWHVNDWTLPEFEAELKQAAGRFVALEHFHQPLGSVLLSPGRDPAASFWVVVAQAGPKLLKSR